MNAIWELWRHVSYFHGLMRPQNPIPASIPLGVLRQSFFACIILLLTESVTRQTGHHVRRCSVFTGQSLH
ncbi:hypothetical protein FOTG_18741 [Fusarium oxysporum f. sp. vasinfectum 25433]|uniref:Uncharacterized protein n=1 Tax=Fusarium oxysporum f. sp. vasinfectum 25433 TaxID=1089449 RepID=X0KGN6_FUSOX|nr:hypothetical protein FOTG_18741 [Fusarium oxysporum f. sp. vasinfectum 25433]